ncbi:MAG: hypothetical protein ACJ75B_00985 [Flavisolibacter sp.]
MVKVMVLGSRKHKTKCIFYTTSKISKGKSSQIIFPPLNYNKRAGDEFFNVNNKKGDIQQQAFFLQLSSSIIAMLLSMFINGELVDAAQINQERIHLPGYIQFLKSELEEKNEDMIDLSQKEPQFFIDTLPSRMNETVKKPVVN